jgi:hypothetical protein
LTKRILLLVLIALACASCDMQKLMKAMTAPQDLALADQCFQELRQRDFAGLKARLSPSVPTTDIDVKLGVLAEAIPAEAPLGSSISSVNTSTVNGHRTVDLTEIYQFPKDWVRFNIRTEGDSADAMRVDFLDVRRIAPPPAPSAAAGLATPIVLAGIALWLGLMFVIYRRYSRKAR